MTLFQADLAHLNRSCASSIWYGWYSSGTTSLRVLNMTFLDLCAAHQFINHHTPRHQILGYSLTSFRYLIISIITDNGSATKSSIIWNRCQSWRGQIWKWHPEWKRRDASSARTETKVRVLAAQKAPCRCSTRLGRCHATRMLHHHGHPRQRLHFDLGSICFHADG